MKTPSRAVTFLLGAAESVGEDAEDLEADLVSPGEQVSKPDQPSNSPGKSHETELTAASHDDAESCVDAEMDPLFLGAVKGDVK